MGRLIAISGGIGSGKSVVSAIVGRLGYRVYDCDSRAKRLMDEDKSILQRLAADIDADAVADGRIDRRRLASVVFGDAGKLARLNEIVHGAVRADLALWVANGRCEPLFVETAILYQSGLDRMVDEVWDVTAPEALRVVRVMKRNGLTAAEVEARIESQTVDVDKPHANVHKIVNDGESALLPQIERLLGLC